jgi:hypothetical protein
MLLLLRMKKFAGLDVVRALEANHDSSSIEDHSGNSLRDGSMRQRQGGCCAFHRVPEGGGAWNAGR